MCVCVCVCVCGGGCGGVGVWGCVCERVIKRVLTCVSPSREHVSKPEPEPVCVCVCVCVGGYVCVSA